MSPGGYADRDLGTCDILGEPDLETATPIKRQRETSRYRLSGRRR